MSERRTSEPRTAYQGASIAFGAVALLFGAWGALDSLFAGDAVDTAGLVISLVFVLLGGGRVYLGLR